MKRGYHALRVKAVVPETADARSYVLDVPDHLRDEFGYRPGQFCTFRVHLDQQDHMRCYSMSSAPETDDDLTVTVKRVPGGLVSNWFNDHVAAGDVLDVSAPTGVFCIRDGPRPVVAFCGGSGVTPVMSIVKTVLATTDRPVKVLYANRGRDSVIFDRELRSLSGGPHAGRFDLRLHFDADGGYLDRSVIADLAAGALDADFYICGPGPFMDLVETALLEIGVDPARISIERFTIAPTPEPVDAAAESTETVTLILGAKKTTIAYRPGDTVLETARRAALQAPFSCEAGNCATCMALLREGSATMRVNNTLTPDELDQGWILTCQALPEGRAITVDYDEV